MEYRLRDLPHLLRVPVGRRRLRAGLVTGLFPLLAWTARAHRRWIVPDVPIITVVGSYGKTTTTRALAAALGMPPPEKDSNAYSTLALHVLRTRRRDRERVVEVSISRPGQGSSHAKMFRPDVTVVTCIGSEHNTSFGTRARTRAEKSKMVQALAPSGLAVLNGDDPDVRSMAELTRAEVVTYGFGDDNDYRASDVETNWPRGTRFRLSYPGGEHGLRTRLHGRHQVYSALAAFAVGLWRDRSPQEIVPAIEALAPKRGRLEPIALNNGAYLLSDDFKSSLETIHAALDFLEELPVSRRLVIMGDISEVPGRRRPTYREIGARIADMASIAVFVGANRKLYAAGARAAGMPEPSIHLLTGDPLQAVTLVSGLLQPGDVVLVKGRGSQRFERISLALAGRTVRCALSSCSVGVGYCTDCPMLERGWEGYPSLA